MAECTSERPRNQRRHASTLALLTLGVCSAAPAADSVTKVTEVRFWSLGEVTRVAIEVSDEFKFKADRLSDPDRLFFDIHGARPAMAEKKTHVIPVGDALIKQIRIAETQPGVTRVVLDLESHDSPVQYTASQLSRPERLMVEVRLRDKPAPPVTSSTSGSKTFTEEGSAPAAKPEVRRFQPPAIAQSAPEVKIQPKPEPLTAPSLAVAMTPARAPVVPTTFTRNLPPPASAAPMVASVSAKSPEPRLPETRLSETKPSETKLTEPKPIESRPIEPRPARRNAGPDESLTRVLGLKLGRVVIDPGHGGHDAGTHGPSGLAEKDVVLDVARRLGALLEQRLSSEVLYTREDDTFVALEDRTRIANDHRADLFLSIHANSSPVRTVTGVETYYLNFTTSKSAMDVAARENASAQSSIFELKDVLEKIAMKDKIDESREFASRIQTSLFTMSAKNNTAARNRGIKKAPFVVLIGASMPSVLAEIGFLTNSSDEALLRKPEHRQKIAEALYKGIESYADGLSHFQVAKRE